MQMQTNYYFNIKLLLTFLCCLHITICSLAQENTNYPNYDFSQIDEYARNVPNSAEKSVASLSHYLAQAAVNDVEKVRSFFVWITHNVVYDMALYHATDLSKIKEVERADEERQRIIEYSLKEKKAVCQGYAELFKALCRAVDIPCYVVPGFTKDETGGQPSFEYANHAWNVVSVDNNWQLLDVTWGSGTVIDEKRFKKSFRSEYFLCQPQTFVIDHLPDNPMWQLLNCPIDSDVFLQEIADIQEFIHEKDSCFAYQDSIQAFHQLSNCEQVLQAARSAYHAQLKSKERLGLAYMNYANCLNLSTAQLQEAKKFEELTQVYQKVLTTLHKAADAGILTKNHKIALCNTYMNQSISLHDRAIDLTESDKFADAAQTFEQMLTLQQEAKKYAPFSDKHYLAVGNTYMNYATALSQQIPQLDKASKWSEIKQVLQKIQTLMKKALNNLEKSKDDRAKKMLVTCKNNIKMNEENLRILRQRTN